jgi:hypothetical protein
MEVRVQCHVTAAVPPGKDIINFTVEQATKVQRGVEV